MNTKSKDTTPADAVVSPIRKFLRDHRIGEVEAVIPDMAGVARGKLVPAEKYMEEEGMRLPESIFLQTVTGEYPDDDSAIDPSEIDIVLKADPTTIRVVPWAAEPTAQVIHDCYFSDGRPVTMSPRYVLRRVLDLYAAQGWEPVVAPELEFFLVEPNLDPDYPLKPPVGRSGRPENGRQSYSISAVNEFDPLFDDVYAYCEAQDIAIDTLIHEAGAAQMEINLLHGNAMDLADQAFLFKRTAREAALRHKMYATFMAKPMAKEPGSAMHIHQSVVDAKTRKQNVFSQADGTPSNLFFSHIAGLQKYLPAAMSLFAPNVNSYRRVTRYNSAPINVHWGYDNRTAGLRVPVSSAASRRVENRIGGADANPYLAMAASLACGYLGMVEGLKPTEPITGSAYDLPFGLPRTLAESLRLLRDCRPLMDVIGEHFVKAYAAVKEAEYEAYLQVISAWEREHLLLNV
jgi:glutamine synthetase